MNKTLKYVVIFIVSVSLGGVLAAFLLPKSFKYEQEMVIEKPMEACWDTYRDDDQRANWVDLFERVVHMEGTPGQQGAIRNVYYKEDTMEYMIVESIQELDSPFHIKYKETANDILSLLTDVTFVELDSNRTLLKVKVSASTDNKPFKFRMFGLKKGFKELTNNRLQRLKSLLEKGGLEARLPKSAAIETSRF